MKPYGFVAVCQSDVDHPEGVLEQLLHLGRLRARDGHDAIEHRLVGLRREPRAEVGLAAHHLRDLAQAEVAIGGVDPLRREGEAEVAAHAQAGRLEHGPVELVRGAGIGGAAEDDQVAGAESLPQLLDRRDDVRDVRILGLGERRRHAHVDAVGAREIGVARRGGEAPGLELAAQLRLGHVADVRGAGVEALDAGDVDVHADHPEARARERERERQSHVSETDDADLRLAPFDPALELGEARHAGGSPSPRYAAK
jgi:hypothetical protein